MRTRATNPVLNAQLVEATNRIINGKFAIDQRANGAAVTVTSSAYTLDRWQLGIAPPGQVQVQREAPGVLPSVFRCALQCAVADTGGSTDSFNHNIEGYNVADLNLGTASAQPFTLAFEAECTIAGTFAVSFRNGAANRAYVATYTLPATTLTPVVITVPGDTTGTWLYDAGLGLRLAFTLGNTSAGFLAPAPNVWSAGNLISVAGMTNLLATAGNALRLRNVRLYRGTTDLGPDQRLFVDELALCRRYYQKSYDVNYPPGTVTSEGRLSGRVYFTGQLEVDQFAVRLVPPMRAVPTVVWYSYATGAANMIRNLSTGADVAVTGNNAAGSGGTGHPTTGAGAGSNLDQIAAHFVAVAEL